MNQIAAYNSINQGLQDKLVWLIPLAVPNNICNAKLFKTEAKISTFRNRILSNSTTINKSSIPWPLSIIELVSHIQQKSLLKLLRVLELNLWDWRHIPRSVGYHPVVTQDFWEVACYYMIFYRTSILLSYHKWSDPVNCDQGRAKQIHAQYYDIHVSIMLIQKCIMNNNLAMSYLQIIVTTIGIVNNEFVTNIQVPRRL